MFVTIGTETKSRINVHTSASHVGLFVRSSVWTSQYSSMLSANGSLMLETASSVSAIAGLHTRSSMLIKRLR